jgi:hypothetical protein
VTPDWAGKWREDLEFVRQEVPAVHPNLYHKVAPDSFHAELDLLIQRVPHLSHHEIELALARIIAMVGDGHTRVTLPLDPAIDFVQGHSKTPAPADPGLGFHQYPLRLMFLEEGLFVTQTDTEHSDALGSRVLQIGELPIETVIDRVSPIVHHDNDWQLLDLVPTRLVLVEVLEGLGIVEEGKPARFHLERESGERIVVEFEPAPEGQIIEWETQMGSGDLPLWLQDTESFYWFEYLEDQNAIYCQYNRCNNAEDELFSVFVDRLLERADREQAQTLILDLRHNWGGSGETNRPLVHGLIRTDPFWRWGSLYVITGRHTFSAAMMLAVDLEKQLNPIFVGEPTGSSPNHYGDSRKLLLPNTGITIRVSTLYWQSSDPRDERDAIPPHLAAPLSFADYRQNRDPALEAILEPLAPGKPIKAGKWTGIMQLGRLTREDATLTLSREGSQWSGTIDIPGQGIEGAPLRELQVDGSQLAFELFEGENLIKATGTLDRGRLIGVALLRGFT